MLRRAILLLSVLLAAAPLPAFAADSVSPIVFNGVLVQDGKTKVSLSYPTTGETKWVQVGKSYAGYTVGYEPGQPATKQTPATKDTVLLTLGGKVQRIPLQDATSTPVVADDAVSPPPDQSREMIAISAQLISLDNANFAVLAALNDRLAQARGDPNADPSQIHELEVAIARQQQKTADDRVDLNYPAKRETTAVNGQLIIIEGPYQFSVPPG